MSTDASNTSYEIPIGLWLRLHIPNHPDIVCFTYVDAQAGLSAKGGPSNTKEFASQPTLTVRLPIPGASWSVLSDVEIARLSLPTSPDWLSHYGNQPSIGTVWGQWRKHPKLQGRLHPEYPDDIQVLVHDGGPRLTKQRPELVWVHIIGVDSDIFKGTVMNQPQQLQTVTQHGSIKFIVPVGGEHALLVTEKYLRERHD